MRVLIAWLACLIVLVTVDGAKKEPAVDRAKEVSKTNPTKDRQDLRKIFDVNAHYTFEVVRRATTKSGYLKKRVQLKFDNLEVFGISLQASYDNTKGFMTDFTGYVVTDIETDIPDTTTCVRDDAFLLEKGLAEFGLPAICPLCELVETKRAILLDSTDKAHLVYLVEISDTTPNRDSQPFMIIDACTSLVYKKFNKLYSSIKPSFISNVHEQKKPVSNRYKRAPCPKDASGTGGNTKVGDINYGTTPYCLDVTNRGRGCLLVNDDVKVINLKQGTSTAGKKTYKYLCHTTKDEINGAKSANLDAFFFGVLTMNVFRDEFDMDEPVGGRVKIYTHFGENYPTAYWRNGAVYIGDGDDDLHPLATLDVIAHEIAHGITELNSNLLYMKQSGGINEAFSDITGEAVEFFASFRTNDWLVGAEVIKAANTAIRYFEDPTKDGSSIAHIDNYNDGLDVHHSSGVYNKAFYEMVETQGIPMKDAYNCFLRANQIYWGMDTGFVQGACDVQSAAVDLGVDVIKIKAAFEVVGIDSNSASCAGGGGGGGGGGTIQPGTTTITVSEDVNPCFELLPRDENWYYVYMIATNSDKAQVSITVKDEDGKVVATRVNRHSFTLPEDDVTNFVCFSSTVATTATIKTYYCGKFCYLETPPE